jgi:hypothetical protein
MVAVAVAVVAEEIDHIEAADEMMVRKENMWFYPRFCIGLLESCLRLVRLTVRTLGSFFALLG